MSPYRYLLLLLIPATVFVGRIGGNCFTFLTPFCCFVLLPLLDLLPKQRQGLLHGNSDENERAYRLIPYVFVLLIVSTVLYGCLTASVKQMGFFPFFGFIVSVGTLNGTIGFSLAHEFIHKNTRGEKMSGYLLLTCAGYLHYSIEHVHGHHVYACTSSDPNSARKGESFYRFFFRSIRGGYSNAWKIEQKRLQKAGQSNASIHNKMAVFLLVQMGMVTMLFFMNGVNAVLFFVGQALVGILLHQQANYLQHYGLTRSETMGKSERMHAHHAWSIPGACRIVDLFQVHNHADHHMHAATPYEKLEKCSGSPQLPANYATMMLIAMVPPLWYKIVHKRLPDFT